MSVKQDFAIVFFAFLILGSLIAWVYLNPPANEQFASLSLLGPSHTAGAYFPNNIAIVSLNSSRPELFNWTLQVYNHMGSAQLYRIDVLLANKTITGPDPANRTSIDPTLEPDLLAFQDYHMVLNNETWNLPIQWSINNATIIGTTVRVQRMTVDGQQSSNLDVTASILDINNYRLVFELWSYDLTSQGFVFSYGPYGSQASVFNQVWFTTKYGQ